MQNNMTDSSEFYTEILKQFAESSDFVNNANKWKRYISNDYEASRAETGMKGYMKFLSGDAEVTGVESTDGWFIGKRTEYIKELRRIVNSIKDICQDPDITVDDWTVFDNWTASALHSTDTDRNDVEGGNYSIKYKPDMIKLNNLSLSFTIDGFNDRTKCFETCKLYIRNTTDSKCYVTDGDGLINWFKVNIDNYIKYVTESIKYQQEILELHDRYTHNLAVEYDLMTMDI